jgi:hypothetical protein
MGGNVFGNTAPIKREDIKPTLTEFLRQFKQIFPKAEPHFSTMKTLGSVGKKDTSGDIDLAMAGSSFDDVDDWGLDREYIMKLFEAFKKRARTSTDDQLMKRAVVVAIAEKINNTDKEIMADMKGSGAGTLFLLFPQYTPTGETTGDNVQIDINVGDVDWLEFAYYSATYQGNVKGLHRTQLLVSLFSHKGYTFSHNYGVKNKETQEIEANTPDQAINLLNTLYGTTFNRDILSDYFKLMDALKSELSQEDLHAVYDTYLKILDSTRADIPQDLQQYWIDNQDRLTLKGKFLPDDSKLIPYKQA